MIHATPHPSTLTVGCYVRAPLILDPIDAKVETLRTCEEGGLIDALVLQTWPAEVARSENSPYREVLDRFAQFERWAERNDVSVRPAFRTRTSRTMASDTETDVLVMPTICLALYDEERLLGVFPHSNGEQTHSVPDAVGALRTGRLPESIEGCATVSATLTHDTLQPESTRSEPGATRQAADSRQRERLDGCPNCDGALVNVQGLRSCLSCDWIEHTRREQLAGSGQIAR